LALLTFMPTCCSLLGKNPIFSHMLHYSTFLPRSNDIFPQFLKQVLIESGSRVNVVFDGHLDSTEIELDGEKKRINLKSYSGKTI
jgi:hypothetical protein